jgi:hypothetical protein
LHPLFTSGFEGTHRKHKQILTQCSSEPNYFSSNMLDFEKS